jgi:hypothetical protein
MMRTYTHFFQAQGCERDGCRVKRRHCGIYQREGGAVLACSVTHAREADRRLSRKDDERKRP